jgi:hypothetical protein
MTSDTEATLDRPATSSNEARPPGRRTWLRRSLSALVALGLLVVVYYGVGMIWVHEIDDDPMFGLETSAPEGGSRTVAVMADLIDREINTHRWVANDPFFMPGALLDNMPNFQQGIIAALARVAYELTDQIARIRGSSQADADLESALGRLNYPGDVWIFEWSRAPVQPSSESQYRRAMQDLHRYNDRLAAGQAVFDRRADNLMATLDRVAADLGGSSAALADHVDRLSGAWLDFSADDLFYATKGRLYGYYIVLRELGTDFGSVIEERSLRQPWDQMLASLEEAASLQPWVVSEGPLDDQFVPNHLAAQGFLLLRARTQLREITNILLK